MTQTYSSNEARLRNTADDLKGKAADQAENIANRVENAAHSAMQQGREVSDNVNVVASNFRTAFDKSMKEQPITTLAMAAGVAFVLGALWKS